MNSTDKLIELFKDFPGIGPRQAKRFVYYLLTRGNGYAAELSKLIAEVKSNVTICGSCFRFFTPERSANAGLGRNGSVSEICSICRDEKRNKKMMMIVSHDVDFENIEKTGGFDGYYFVLGGTVPILDKNPETRIRQTELLRVIERRIAEGLSEIIIAENYNPDIK
jgi:recombination protein RecR